LLFLYIYFIVNKLLFFSSVKKEEGSPTSHATTRMEESTQSVEERERSVASVANIFILKVAVPKIPRAAAKRKILVGFSYMF
jgi:hypothetical protein